MLFRGLLLFVSVFLAAPSWALSLLTYNVKGNGTTDWSTNAAQVQAIGRQMKYLQPDIVTFNEIPSTNRWQMTNFVKAYLPGYSLATNSGSDGFPPGFICSVIASRYPITRSQSWLDGVSLVPFGYTGPNPTFTRDLFEAQINVPGFSQPLHVFTTHLKAGSSDINDLARRAAEASAISNFFVTGFLTTNAHRPYVLTGDLNEDINRPPGGSKQPIQRLTNAAVGLRLTTPRNPFNNDDRTWSIQSGLSKRFDYILPGGLLFSNIASNQVFRSDLLNPTPAGLFKFDDQTASDHLPVLTVFFNPYDTVFQLTSLTVSNSMVRLEWQTTPERKYRVEESSNLLAWSVVSTNISATTTNLTWSTNQNSSPQFFRIYRLP